MSTQFVSLFPPALFRDVVDYLLCEFLSRNNTLTGQSNFTRDRASCDVKKVRPLVRPI